LIWKLSGIGSIFLIVKDVKYTQMFRKREGVTWKQNIFAEVFGQKNVLVRIDPFIAQSVSKERSYNGKRPFPPSSQAAKQEVQSAEIISSKSDFRLRKAPSVINFQICI